MSGKFLSILSIFLMLTILLSACNQGTPLDSSGKDDQIVQVSDYPDDTQNKEEPTETIDPDHDTTSDPGSNENNDEDQSTESTPEPTPEATPEPVITREGKNDTYMYNVYNDAFIEIVRYTGQGETHLIIPDTIEGLPVVRIGDSSIKVNKHLFTTDIRKVTLPDTIEYIGPFAFSGLYVLDEINFPEGLRYIGENAFQYTKIKEVTIPNGVEYIGNEVFDHTPYIKEATEEFLIVGDGILLKYCGSEENVDIPDGVKVVGASSFQKNDTIKSVVIPESVTKIWMGAFFMSSLESVTLPDSITEIESYAFYSTELKEITLPAGLKNLESSMFVNCGNLTKVDLPQGLEIIGDQAFNSCVGLTDIIIPDGVYEIGNGAFAFCDNLGILTIPSSVYYIGRDTISYSTTIEAPANSYAIDYAIENGYEYIAK